MSYEEFATYREIKSQTEVWEKTLAVTDGIALPNAADYEQAIFTRCGSTYYLSLAAAALYQELVMKEMTLTDSEPFHFLEFPKMKTLGAPWQASGRKMRMSSLNRESPRAYAASCICLSGS
jgi:hypothetical protein